MKACAGAISDIGWREEEKAFTAKALRTLRKPFMGNVLILNY